MRGWVDNLNGPTGLFLIAGIGVMRTAVVHEDILTDGVPVDTCANLTIASAWNTDREYRSVVRVRGEMMIMTRSQKTVH